MSIKLSATRISTFLQCKMRYAYSYVIKESKTANPAFRLGTAVHEALEKAGQLLMEADYAPFDEARTQEVLDAYHTAAVREGVYDSTDYIEGLSIIKRKLLNLEGDGKIIALEQKFGFEGTPSVVTSGGAELIGAIDKVVHLDDETLIIKDYKTSKTIPDTEKLRSDIQLSMYDYVARRLYPGYKRIILALDMVKHNELVFTYRTPEEVVDFEQFLNTVYEQMVNFNVETAKTQLNPLCSWCDFRNICNEYKSALIYDSSDVLPPEQLTPEQLHEEWSSVNSKLQLIKTRKDELATYIMGALDTQVEPISNGTSKFAIAQRSRDNFDARALAKVIPLEDFVGLVSTSSKKVKDYAQSNPKIKESILSINKPTFNQPFVETKKLVGAKKTKSKK